MATETVTIELDRATAAKLQTIANALQLSLDEYLSKVAELVAAPQTNGQEKTEELTPFELVEDLIGSVDSSLPDDSAAPSHRPPLYYNVVEKLKKQGLKVS
ncbi:MAG TPA: hypothetical protein VE715_09685 [Blastocatellia bacterium]|nr:hypothetical protein [Blastocatellia bacterium]